MLEIFNLLGWESDDSEDGGSWRTVATFATTPKTPEPKVRAHEVMRRLMADEAYESMSIEQVEFNLSNQDLGLKPTLAEIAQRDFVDAAAKELFEHGSMQVPLWLNPAWLVHEVRANYDVGIDFHGRRMSIVSKDEMARRVQVGDAPERRGRPVVQTEPDDGFVETS